MQIKKRCKACHNIFEIYDIEKVIHSDGIETVCPVCRHNNFENVVICEHCKRPKPTDNINDGYCRECTAEIIENANADMLKAYFRKNVLYKDFFIYVLDKERNRVIDFIKEYTVHFMNWYTNNK